MPTSSDEFRKQVNELWKQACVQLEQIKEAVLRSSSRYEAQLDKLRAERNRLLKIFGEATHELATQSKVPMPEIVRHGIETLNQVVTSVVEGPRRSAPKAARSVRTRPGRGQAATKRPRTRKKVARPSSRPR